MYICKKFQNSYDRPGKDRFVYTVSVHNALYSMSISLFIIFRCIIILFIINSLIEHLHQIYILILTFHSNLIIMKWRLLVFNNY